MNSLKMTFGLLGPLGSSRLFQSGHLHRSRVLNGIFEAHNLLLLRRQGQLPIQQVQLRLPQWLGRGVIQPLLDLLVARDGDLVVEGL